MKIINKVKILNLAFAGLSCQNTEAHQSFTEAIFEFETEIEEYFQTHLPEQHKIYGRSVIAELKDIAEQIFKDSNSPRKTELTEYLGKASLVAHLIPEDKQDI